VCERVSEWLKEVCVCEWLERERAQAQKKGNLGGGACVFVGGGVCERERLRTAAGH
jgi:hypothetical protein